MLLFFFMQAKDALKSGEKKLAVQYSKIACCFHVASLMLVALSVLSVISLAVLIATDLVNLNHLNLHGVRLNLWIIYWTTIICSLFNQYKLIKANSTSIPTVEWGLNCWPQVSPCMAVQAKNDLRECYLLSFHFHLHVLYSRWSVGIHTAKPPQLKPLYYGVCLVSTQTRLELWQ